MEDRFSAGLWVFAAPVDRFNPGGYAPEIPPVDQIHLAGRVDGLSGLELHWPTDFNGSSWELSTKILDENVEKIKSALREEDLTPTCLNVNTFGFRDWRMGAFTHPDERLRARAVECAKMAVEVARMIGCPTVGLWLGADGFDYPFQVDYHGQWSRLLSSIEQVASFAGEVKVSIEYKLKEPRTHMQVATVGKGLYICHKLGLENLGVTLDFGHALMAYENPAESAALLAAEGKLFNVHMNDAYGYWDDDMVVGVLNPWETLEFLYYTAREGYDGYYSLDIYPYREDPVRAAQMSIDNLRSLMEKARRIDRAELERAQVKMDALKAFEAVRGVMYD